MFILEFFSHMAAIATAVVAVWAWIWYHRDRDRKRVRLEQHLRKEKVSDTDMGQRTLLHLMRNVKMTEAEIMDAAFRSEKIEPHVKPDKDGQADRLYFEYTGDDLPEHRKGKRRF